MPTPEKQSSAAPRRLEIGVFAPGIMLRNQIVDFLRRNGFMRAADTVQNRIPVAAEHVMVFDADAVTAVTDDLVAATVAIFGPTKARGEEVGKAAFQDATRFIAAEQTTEALETTVTALEGAEARTRELLATIQSALTVGRTALANARWQEAKP